MNAQSDTPSEQNDPVIFNPLSPSFTANPYPILHRLRDQDPVHLSKQGFWVLTRYDDVAEVLRNSQMFGAGNVRESLRARYGDGAAFAYVSRRMNQLDPPEHTRLRSLVTRAFSARRVMAMRPHIQAIADHLLDRLGSAQSMDVIAALAHPLPSLVICEMLGVPEGDRFQLSVWTGDVQLLFGPVVTSERRATGEKATAAFMEYIRALAQERRHHPGDDLLSALIAAEEQGDRLTEDELVATILFLFTAGHSTTRDLVGNGLLALLHHPDQWRRLIADPALLPAAIEECLRYDPPVTIFPRTALVNTTLRGKSITAGEQLYVSISAANRDPMRFSDPDCFVLDRTDNAHLAFGGGIHHCLGAGLARAEAHIIFGTLCRRYPHLQLAGEPIEWRQTLAFRGPVALHVIMS